MKKLLSIFTLLLTTYFIQITNNSSAQSDKSKAITIDTSECLQVTGSFDGSVKDFEGTYTAKLFKNNKVIEKQELKVKKQFVFMLKKNMTYIVKVEKDGYIPKSISISTTLPAKLEVGDPFKFHFETNLLSNDLQSNFSDDDIDFPVALISYSRRCDCFEFNKEYTQSLIRRMVSNMIFGG